MKPKQHKILLIEGDGIGPDVINESVQLLSALPLNLQFSQAEAGYGAYLRSGTPLPDVTVKKCRQADAILFGAVTSPPNIDNYFSPIVRLRKLLQLYANIRPFFSLPLKSMNQGIDFILFRENTEDLYAGHEKLIQGGAVAERVITKKGSELIIKAAFTYAQKQKRKKVTVVHKANVLRLTDGLFLQVAHTVAKKYPDIIFEEMLVDNCAMQLVKNPKQFDVIVTTNMFGDILSDESAALVGGLGVVASANIGDKNGLFEPVHGSAPKYAGKNIANPLACFLASAMMLDYLDEKKEAGHIRNAIMNTLKKGQLTRDLGGKLQTREFTNAVMSNL